MVTLKDIFELLSQGEIRSQAIGGATTGGVAAEDYPKLIPHINLGLTAIHKRFQLLTDYAIVVMYPHITEYELSKKFAATNTESSELIKYIDDNGTKPFEDLVLNIREVYNEIGAKLPINDFNSPNSVFLNGDRGLRVDNPVEYDALTVVYCKDHPRIPNAPEDPSLVELDINNAYIEPLLFYVASRVHAGIGTVNGVNESSNYMRKYELSCLEIERGSLNNSHLATNLKSVNNGWV